MKAKRIQIMIGLTIFAAWFYPAWGATWSYYDTASVGDMYYDKSSVRQAGQNVVSVWTKNILSEKSKAKYFSILQGAGKAPASPSVLGYYEELLEIDYAGRRIKNVAVVFYDRENRVIYASPKSETGDWRPIEPNSVGDKLSNLVSWEAASPAETAEASGSKDLGIPATADPKPAPDKNGGKNIGAVAAADSRNAAPAQKEIGKTIRPTDVIKPEKHEIERKKNSELAAQTAPIGTAVVEIRRDGRFIVYENQTVVDTKTNLMWAAHDNGRAVNWYGAKKYCEKYRGGGYTDWRMPTADELAGLYDISRTQFSNPDATPLHATVLINLSACCPWASETQGSQAAYFDFSDGTRWWFLTPGTRINRAIPVRAVK